MALDSWLAAAEGLLYEQRSRSISPSSYTGSWSDGVHESTSTVREVGAGLEDLLRQLTQAPGRWIFVIRDARTPAHYIQFLSYEDGSFLAEVVSNYFLDQLQDTRPRWDEAQEKKLAALGWQAPAPTWLPNWTEIWPVYAPKVDVVAARARRTLAEVFGLSDDDAVVVRMFSSPNRGKTPASEVVDPSEAESAAKTHPRPA